MQLNRISRNTIKEPLSIWSSNALAMPYLMHWLINVLNTIWSHLRMTVFSGNLVWLCISAISMYYCYLKMQFQKNLKIFSDSRFIGNYTTAALDGSLIGVVYHMVSWYPTETICHNALRVLSYTILPDMFLKTIAFFSLIIIPVNSLFLASNQYCHIFSFTLAHNLLIPKV